MHLIHDPNAPAKEEISFDQFLAVDIRAGTIEKAEPFPEARKPSYKLWINFGEGIGIRKSSAQITDHYTLEDLIGKKVAAVVNFPKRQIGPFMSEVLVVGFPDEKGHIVLTCPDKQIPDGAQLC